MDTIKIAALSLKHRSNKSQKPRIIVFNGSPILEEEKTLVTLGKKLRKNKVALDVVNFGHPENAPLIQALVNAVNNSENSHFIDVPSHVQFLSDGLMGSPVMVDSDVPMGDGGAGDPGAGMAMPGGIDPNVDPELAQAIQISLEEAKAQEAQPDPPAQDAAAEAAPPQTDVQNDVEMQIEEEAEDEEEAEMLRKAMEMSMQPTAKEPKKEEEK